MLDLHVHDAHFIRLLFGLPQAVHSKGRMRQDLAEFWQSQFDYDSAGFVVQATSGTVNQQGRSFDHGFEIHFEKVVLTFEFAVVGKQASYLCPPTVLTNDGKAKRPSLGSGDPMDAFQSELKEVVRCVRNQTPSAILDSDLARDAIQLCQKQTESLRNGRVAKL